MQNILVTGVNGFVGNALFESLNMSEGTKAAGLLRHGGSLTAFKPDAELRYFSDFHDNKSLELALKDIDCAVHCAARVHMMNDKEIDPLVAFRKVNTEGTLNLARLAARAGVRRFIFLSTIKTLGEQTLGNKSFAFNDPLQPEDPYAISKAEAEAGLKQIAAQTGMEVVIIRPPLVYGPGVRANFASMMKLAKKNLPLPLGAISNKRSLVSVDNLVDLIITCIHHADAANQTFLVSDGHDVSTTELMRELTRAAGKKPRLLPVPMEIIRLLCRIVGKSAIADRLCGSLQVDISHTKQTLGWVPPLSFQESIARTVTGEVETC